MKRIALFRIVCAAGIFLSSIRAVAAVEQETGTIKGPETPGLAGNVHGHVVMWEEAGITALELPDCKQQIGHVLGFDGRHTAVAADRRVSLLDVEVVVDVLDVLQQRRCGCAGRRPEQNLALETHFDVGGHL